ncbi:hypothetical protein BH23VER1_BH23VER1_24600 [soil metagenome]
MTEKKDGVAGDAGDAGEPGESALALQRLDSEMRKKEVLLHCVIDDISGALGNIVTSLRLLELEPTAAKVSYLLSLAMAAARRQQELIDEVVAGFSSELEQFYGRQGERRGASDIGEVVREAAAGVADAYRKKGLRLELPQPLPGGLRVQGAPSLLVRMLGAVLVNACRAAPDGSTVTVGVSRSAGSGGEVEISVSDSAPAADSPGGQSPFDGLALFGGMDGAIELSFCRMAVENIGGEVGHETVGDREGNRYWARLPEAKEEPA